MKVPTKFPRLPKLHGTVSDRVYREVILWRRGLVSPAYNGEMRKKGNMENTWEWWSKRFPGKDPQVKVSKGRFLLSFRGAQYYMVLFLTGFAAQGFQDSLGYRFPRTSQVWAPPKSDSRSRKASKSRFPTKDKVFQAKVPKSRLASFRHRFPQGS